MRWNALTTQCPRQNGSWRSEIALGMGAALPAATPLLAASPMSYRSTCTYQAVPRLRSPCCGDFLHSLDEPTERRLWPKPYRTSGVDLTFAPHLAAGSPSECQIQNSIRSLHLLVVLDSNIRKDAR